MATRNTVQQSAIREVLRDAGRPLSPPEILEAGRAEAPRLGLATVYRCIQRLLDAELLRRVQVPGLPDRFEWAAGEDHRHYFFCRHCERLYDVHACPGGIEKLAPRGFRAEEHELLIRGLCSECQEDRS